ncbi:MAG TPA: hypothetical protein VM510_12330, partial [Caulifigura sp.]|nr:hypothetical protein [Caulifigura sp.]
MPRLSFTAALLATALITASVSRASDQLPAGHPPVGEAPAKTDEQKQAEEKEKAAKLTLDRIFTAHEFDGEPGPRVTWSKRRPGYFQFASAKAGVGRDLVYVDPASGEQEI